MITMAVQAAGIAIIATGMVLVIVSRNIDLSVGSLVGLIAMSYALLMTDWFPRILGIGPDVPFQWVLALALGHRARRGRRGDPGLHHRLHRRAVLHRHARRPAVDPRPGLVPVAGRRRDRARPDLPAHRRRRPRARSASSSPGSSAIVGCVAIVGLLVQQPAAAAPLRLPGATDVGRGAARRASAARSCSASPGSRTTPFWPKGLADQYAAEHGITEPPGGLQIPTGFPYPIVLLIGVTLVMTFIANRRRFGRYVYAYGGNPDAAELAGINTRWTILKTYVLMGVLCALAAAIAAARLNGSTLDIGESYELYVIAAAVVGGTSFAGGIGTIPGAVLGAFVMQSLAYGLSFLGVNSPGQNVVAGIVLILAVGLDTLNRRRGS